MANTGKQSPLGAGVNGSLLQDVGLCLNPPTVGYVGTSHLHNYADGNDPYSPGSLVNGTCLKWLTYSIRKGYDRVRASEINSTTYGNLINIGGSTVPALGNSKAPTFAWYGPANGGDPTSDYVQTISWYPYQATDTTNIYPTSNPTANQYSNLTQSPYHRSITQWGWIRLFALQAWNEFNWNGYPSASKVYYKEFLSSFNTISAYIDYANVSINAQAEGPTFLKNTYSNIDDLISADIAGISKATAVFGQDLIKSGKVIDLANIDKFGLPSVLLMTLQKYNAITGSLSYAILASGLSITDLNSILSGIMVPNRLQEKQLYGAFTVITGDDLKNILIPLNCSTSGLNSLADLLNPIKLFPNSYASLTVPVYNTGPGPTNAKTYYLIYNNSGVNSQLTSAAVSNAIGFVGVPPLNNSSNVGTNYQPTLPGFGSYLQDILPSDIATACGAINVSMRQVSKINSVPIEKFAQVVANIESTKGLPLTAGTSVPSNTTLTAGGLTQTAFGSGPNGSWVMSDFLGCMSGLPYPWKDIQSAILNLQTTKLKNIYQELYLAIHWEAATITVQYTSYQVETDPGPPPTYTTYYHVTGVTITNQGGGYGRGTSPVPIITINGGSGATATCTIGTDPNNLGTYGKVITATLTSSGTDVTTPPTATVQCPPTATLAVLSNGNKATGGTNTASGTTGWTSPMQSVVQAYIDQSNTEITSIQSANQIACSKLNKNWNVTGTQLTIEQHARDIALTPVPTPKDNRINPYPVAIHTYVDYVPVYASKTEPHMQAQTIDAISDMSTPGGQSLVALQRAERNQQRLIEAGIAPDDNMGGEPNALTTKILMANGTVSIAAQNQGIPAGAATFTNPANQESTGAKPFGYFNAVDNNYRLAPMTTGSVLGTIPDDAQPGQDLAGPNIIQVNDPITPISGGSVITGVGGGSSVLVASSGDAAVGDVLNLGQPVVPGSLASSDYINLIPPQLSVPFISGIVSPSVYSVEEAIDEVVRCNCDCWL